MAPNLQTDDAAIQRVLTTLETHIEAMMRAGAQVENVNSEVQQHFRAACSTAYQGKIQDWQGRYQQLKNAYQTFHGTFGAGHRQVSHAHDEALGIGGSWGSGPSADVYNGLNP
ncbi:hypothetical protein ACFQ6N_29745 [Kitasatospora sp. NPDC056446]|uniref:hypothetical protein n=1 Tax=Kitasatospora sp. NPDC056446 TaxID=3345819 RepID=UPI0036AADF12